ncbi:MAG: S41 family peptidase [Planctomycetota bacterium]|nr:S41 family peptidase [Planctomycetaceae bacterium]MDQ3331036.1 S41 family peptidase [Planctomycetota bacterium]
MSLFCGVGRAIALVAIVITVCGSSWATAQAPAEAAKADAPPAQSTEPQPGDLPDDQYFELFREFVDTFEQIDRNYVKEVDRKELMRAAITGMLTELDPYSSYIPPADLADFTQGIEQEFGGIGIQVQIDPETRRLTVVTPLPGTPAYRSGVLSGDVIMEVGGESTEGFTVEDAVKKLKGKPGEAVTIGVLHKGSESVEQIELVREVIQVATVLGDRYKTDGTWDFMIDDADKVGYVRLTHFSRRTGEELRDALEQLQSKGMKGLVLDLRFNPGGLLSEAVEVCDLFLEKGTIVSTKGRNVPERSWEAHQPGTYSGFPIAVLVNRYSASASEIVSACLQDNDRAVVVGERTWGKGSVQNVIDIGGGASALKLTTASYLRPNGHNIHRFPDSKEEDEWGVKPDDSFEIKLSDDELRDYLIGRRKRDVIGSGDENRPKDRQLDAALARLREKITGKPAQEPAKPAQEAQKTGSTHRLDVRALPA